MVPLHFSRLLLLSGVFLLTIARTQAQQTTSRVLIVSPLVGETIDQREKRFYGLFPYFSTAEFQLGQFEQSLSPDSTITLQATFVNGSTRSRVFTAAQVEQVRQAIESRQRELTSPEVALPGQHLIGGTYTVQLFGGSSFVGELVAQRLTELDFTVKILGPRTVKRSAVKQMELMTPTQVRLGWDPVGNGTRLFLAPTARPLRRGEGYVQNINVFVLGAGYGISDHVSLGALALVSFGSAQREALLVLMPKYSAPLTEKFRLGAGAYLSPVFNTLFGIGYGVGTYGTADDNLSVGLGYAFVAGHVFSTPGVVVGGTTRVLRRLSLLNETYVADGSFFGLAGVRMAAPRLSGSLALAYGNGLQPTLAYLEGAYRFGTVK